MELMKRFFVISLIGALTVVVFDAAGAMGSLRFGFDYRMLFVGSILIYAAAGFAASKYCGWRFAPLAGGIAGLADATLGWYVSSAIGPGRTGIETDAAAVAATIVFVTVIGAVIGFAGGLAARLIYGKAKSL